MIEDLCRQLILKEIHSHFEFDPILKSHQGIEGAALD
jgi:hypothetical protein